MRPGETPPRSWVECVQGTLMEFHLKRWREPLCRVPCERKVADGVDCGAVDSHFEVRQLNATLPERRKTEGVPQQGSVIRKQK